MALKDILKRKKRKEITKIAEATKVAEVAPTERPTAVQAGKKEIKVKKRKKTSKLAYRVLKGPHITEKATDLAKKNQYVFKIFPRTNKIEVKRAIEEIYGVKVIDVRVVNIPRKPKRLGRTSGWKKGYKKAIVKIKQGQKIEITPR